MCYEQIRPPGATVLLLVAAAACSSDTRSPVSPEPTPSTDIDYPENIQLEGRITSAADDSPLEDARIVLYDETLCDYWAMVYGRCSELVAEETTDPDGRFGLFYTPCSPGNMRVEIHADGYEYSDTSDQRGIRVDCAEHVQDVSRALTVVPVSLGASFPPLATVGEPTHIGYRAYAHAGLAWISADWGDGSSPERSELSGLKAEGTITHTYENPGQYWRSVTVADSSGNTETLGLRLTVSE